MTYANPHSLGVAILTLAPIKALAAEPAAVQTAVKFGAETSAASYLMQLTLGLIVVLAAIAALAWLLRRTQAVGASVSGGLKVLGGVAIGQRERVVLVQVGETQLLIGVAPGSIRTLHELSEPLDTHAPGIATDAQSFAARLGAALKRGRAQ